MQKKRQGKAKKAHATCATYSGSDRRRLVRHGPHLEAEKVFNDRLVILKHESCAAMEIQDATDAELQPGSARARLSAASQACMLKASEQLENNQLQFLPPAFA